MWDRLGDPTPRYHGRLTLNPLQPQLGAHLLLGLAAQREPEHRRVAGQGAHLVDGPWAMTRGA